MQNIQSVRILQCTISSQQEYSRTISSQQGYFSTKYAVIMNTKYATQSVGTRQHLGVLGRHIVKVPYYLLLGTGLYFVSLGIHVTVQNMQSAMIFYSTNIFG